VLRYASWMIRRFSLGVLLTLALTVCAEARQMPGADVAVKSPSGLRALGSTEAVVWSLKGAHFKLWQLDAAGPAIVTKVLPVPAELTQHLKSQTPDETEDDAGYVDVETQGVEIRLLWFEDVPQSDADHEKSNDFPELLVQASSADLGVTWRVDRSPFRTSGGAEWVYKYEAVDAQHAWLLGAGEPGAGQLPEELFRTVDGGRTWKLAEGDSYEHGPPIGSNGGQILAVKDADHAWFIATCAGCDEDAFLSATATEDGGKSWKPAKLMQHYPECTNCYPMNITRSPVAAGDCFDVDLRPMDEGDKRQSVPEHFCSLDGGRTWEKPQVGLTVRPKEGFSYGGDLSSWATYAKGAPELGVTVDSKEKPADAQHKTEWYEQKLMETRDGGVTWSPILPELRASLTPIRGLEARGRNVWLMLSEGAGAKILHSRDRGATWELVSTN